jgi:hypothetical protein
MKPYAPRFFGSYSASIPVDENGQLSVSLSTVTTDSVAITLSVFPHLLTVVRG